MNDIENHFPSSLPPNPPGKSKKKKSAKRKKLKESHKSKKAKGINTNSEEISEVSEEEEEEEKSLLESLIDFFFSLLKVINNEKKNDLLELEYLVLNGK